MFNLAGGYFPNACIVCGKVRASQQATVRLKEPACEHGACEKKGAATVKNPLPDNLSKPMDTFVTTKSVSQCSRCAWVSYCSVECQKMHFKTHAPLCKAVAKLWKLLQAQKYIIPWDLAAKAVEAATLKSKDQNMVPHITDGTENFPLFRPADALRRPSSQSKQYYTVSKADAVRHYYRITYERAQLGQLMRRALTHAEAQIVMQRPSCHTCGVGNEGPWRFVTTSSPSFTDQESNERKSSPLVACAFCKVASFCPKHAHCPKARERHSADCGLFALGLMSTQTKFDFLRQQQPAVWLPDEPVPSAPGKPNANSSWEATVEMWRDGDSCKRWAAASLVPKTSGGKSSVITAIRSINVPVDVLHGWNTWFNRKKGPLNFVPAVAMCTEHLSMPLTVASALEWRPIWSAMLLRRLPTARFLGGGEGLGELYSALLSTEESKEGAGCPSRLSIRKPPALLRWRDFDTPTATSDDDSKSCDAIKALRKTLGSTWKLAPKGKSGRPLTIYVLGATASVELQYVTKFEELVHSLDTAVRTVNFVFVGPDLVPIGDKVHEQNHTGLCERVRQLRVECCDACVKGHRTINYFLCAMPLDTLLTAYMRARSGVKDPEGHHTALLNMDGAPSAPVLEFPNWVLPSPDLFVGLHTGMHSHRKGSSHNPWHASLCLIRRSSIPLLLTCYDWEETVMTAELCHSMGFTFLQKPQINRFHALVPIRSPSLASLHTMYFANQYVMCVVGSLPVDKKRAYSWKADVAELPSLNLIQESTR